MAERHTALVQSAVESIWNRGDLDLADVLFGPAYINHGGVIPDIVCGPEAIKLSVVLYRTAFPALFVAIDGLVADGDMVELHWAAHTPPLHHALTGGAHSQRLRGTTRTRFSHDQIVESWTTWNRRDFLIQLGHATSTGRAGRAHSYGDRTAPSPAEKRLDA